MAPASNFHTLAHSKICWLVFIYIPNASPSKPPPPHTQSSPFTSEMMGPPRYPHTLAHQVSVGLGTSFLGESFNNYIRGCFTCLL